MRSVVLFSMALAAVLTSPLIAQELTWPPKLPNGQTRMTVSGPKLLQPTGTLREGIAIAKTPPTVDVMYYPGQDYPGNPWSVWGDGLVVGDVYYSAIGDHKSPEGNAFVYAYNSKTQELKQLVDVRSIVKRPPGHYTPGKIHSQIGLGADGWLYFSTHRGSTRVGLDPKNHYEGDWILRHHPETGKSEVVVYAPLPTQCLPTGLLDPDRLIWYSGTADGLNEKEPQFLAYDLQGKKVLYSDPYGPYRAMIFAPSTGMLYFHGKTSEGSRGVAPLVRFNPEKPGEPTPIPAEVGLRAASQETPDGKVYTVEGDELWVFDTKTETAKSIGPSAVASKDYTTSLDIDPKTNRYMYYVPGAHGGAEADGCPLVQYDLKTGTRKVVAFLHPLVYEKAGYICQGTYSVAVSPEGDQVYLTWNGNTGTKPEDLDKKIRFNACALTVVHIPASERQP